MKVLVTGAQGMLGRDLTPLLSDSHDQVFETDIEELDITKIEQLKKACKMLQPDVIVNCAAYTQVDKAEQEPKEAFLVNGKGIQNLAVVCKEFDIELCHVSTDYVFSGEKQSPYSPFDTPHPINAYGRSKLAGERYIQKIWDRFYIIRTSWLYGKHGKNFVFTVLDLVRKKKVLKVVDDQVGSPTWTITLAWVLSKLIQTKRYGIYHVTDKTRKGISWFRFAEKIVKLTGSRAKVIPIRTEDFPCLAKRPKNSILDLTQVQQVLNEDMPYWTKSLQNFLFEISHYWS